MSLSAQVKPQELEEPFSFPIVTVDGIVFQLKDDKLTVLLIRRAFEPFLGVWALPGGFISQNETSNQALERVLVQKTGISTGQFELIEQPHAFDAPARDPRGYAITVMYMGLGGQLIPGEHAGMTNGQSPQFFPVTSLPELAYDHAAIVSFAHDRLKALLTDTNVAAPLMPSSFTLTELQGAYEALLCKKLDKRNFRKNILALDLLVEAGAPVREGAHRPARLYAFRTTALQQSLSKAFL